MLAEVSTHSRPKAAGERYRKSPVDTDCFNTQPPEGGWAFKLFCSQQGCCFNTQPPKGGWTIKINDDNTLTIVSTHSRLKAAGRLAVDDGRVSVVSTHSRLKAAGIGGVYCSDRRVSFNTQPPEGGWLKPFGVTAKITVSTHSRLKAAGASRHRARCRK